jgi:nucleotide-binding universal stress UspA family protein
MQPVPMTGVDVGVALPEIYVQKVEVDVQRNMEEALARVTAAGLMGERIVLYGVPFQEIAETAKARQVDLIVMSDFLPLRSGLYMFLRRRLLCPKNRLSR